MYKNFFLIFKNVDKKFEIKFIFLNLIYILNSFVQSIYILSIAPIISYIVLENKNQTSQFMQKIVDFGYKYFDNEIVIYFVFFIISSLIANSFVIILNFINFSFNQNLLSKIRKKLFSKYLNSDYLYINSQNLSFYNTIIFQQVDRLVSNVFGSLNLIIQNTFTTLMILFSISFILKINILGISILIVVFLLLCVLFTKKFFSQKGEELNKILKGRIDILNKLILNFKEVKIFSLKKYLAQQYGIFENNFNKNIKYTSFFNHSSKPFIEIIAVTCLSFLIFTNFSLILSGNFIIQFSVVVFALYKILPSANVIYTAINQINFDKSSINVISDQIFRKSIINIDNSINHELNKEVLKEKLISLSLNNLSFKYGDQNLINNFNYNFKTNNFYLIKGPSGRGKSTLLNLLIGILPFRSGDIILNNKKFFNYNNQEWFKFISYVPQKITLLNNTIKENITFSFDSDMNDKKYIDVLKKVNLYEEFLHRENEIISEFSSNISGGQAQRIGLARALYRDSKIIFLDEPTSNLDEKNEINFLKLVNNLKKDRIIIMISHKNHKMIVFDDIINF